MPLPLVHLSIAEGLHARLGTEPTGEFLLGSISPDAIHVRPGTTRAHKSHTHLRDVDAPWPEPVRAWLRAHARETGTLREILRGYAAHLLADRLWARTTLLEFRERASESLDEAALRTLYYRELDQIDIDLYRAAPWQEAFWRRLADAAALDVPGLLSAAEIDAWRQRTLGWFEDPAHDPGIVPRHITHERVHAFVVEATEAVSAAAGSWEEW